MNIPSEKYVVGYGRPAEHSKWKKGQCRNPARIRECAAKPVVAMIDEFFASEHVAVENSIRKRRSALEIILLQLHKKAICGSTRAFNVLTKYHEFAATTRGPNPLRVALLQLLMLREKFEKLPDVTPILIPMAERDLKAV